MMSAAVAAPPGLSMRSTMASMDGSFRASRIAAVVVRAPTTRPDPGKSGVLDPKLIIPSTYTTAMRGPVSRPRLCGSTRR